MKTRIMSAAIAIPFGILILVINNMILYRVVIGAISATAVFELLVSIKYLSYKTLCAVSLAHSFCMPFSFSVDMFYDFRILFSLVYLLIIFIILIINNKTISFEKIATTAFSSIFIPFSLSCLLFAVIDYGEHSTFVLVFVLVSAWTGDAGAYFVGTFFGKHKMAPEISPKKTWEGFLGGLITSGIAGAVLAFGYRIGNYMFSFTSEFEINIIYLVIIALISSALGVVGDFSASVLKRQFLVKDFGNVMPGHGGVLDRFDSVLFVAPFVYFIFGIYFPII